MWLYYKVYLNCPGHRHQYEMTCLANSHEDAYKRALDALHLADGEVGEARVKPLLNHQPPDTRAGSAYGATPNK